MTPRSPSGEQTLRQTSLWRWLVIALSPFFLTVVVLTFFYGTIGRPAVPQTPTGVYTLLNILVVGLVMGRVSSSARAEIFPVRVPQLQELVTAVAVTLVSILVIDPVATVVATVFGGASGSVGSFESVLGAVIFGVSSIVIAPVVEEVLFRGLALGALRVRYGVVVAIVGSSMLFGGLHLALGGVSGVVSAFLSGLLYAGLRIRYKNLTGAMAAHCLNNVYWVAVMLGVVPNLVPL